MSVVKKIGGGFGYLKRDSGLYGHEDGRNEDRLHGKNSAPHGKKAFFQGEKPGFNTIDKRYASLLNKQYYTISVR